MRMRIRAMSVLHVKVQYVAAFLLVVILLVIWMHYTSPVITQQTQQETVVLRTPGTTTRKRPTNPWEREPEPGGRNILLFETRCVLNESKAERELLSKRQACSVESAARASPWDTLYLFYSCPMKPSVPHVDQVLSMRNVKLWKINLKDLFLDSPVQNWDLLRYTRRSNWPVEDASDVLRFLALWKYGGTYLDLDFIVIQSLVGLGTNFVVREDPETIGTSVMNLEHEGEGHKLASLFLQEVFRSYEVDIDGHEGLTIITKTMNDMCGTTKVSEMTAAKCRGIRILPENFFYPVHYMLYETLFSEEGAEDTMRQINTSLAVHMWNSITKDEPVSFHSNAPYAQLAKTYCPSVVTSQQWIEE